MKRISILSIIAGFIYISHAFASFEPLKINLIVDKDTLPYKQETDDAIRNFIHFFFVKEKKDFTSCYALVALKANDYRNPIGIVKGELYTTLKKWEYISLPKGVNGTNLKYIGLLDDRLTLITQERTTFGNNYYSCIYQYDPFKKSALNFLSPIALENPGWNKLYETAPHTLLSKFTGNNSQSWWMYIKREYPAPGLISHVSQDKNGLKVEKLIDALWITTTPDNRYRWTIEPRKGTNDSVTLLIEDLEDTDEFKDAALIELSNNMPRQIKNLIAFDGTKAYCIDNLGKLYEIDNQGSITLIPINIGSIDTIAYLNNQLVVAHDNKLYIYKPKIKQPGVQKSETIPNVAHAPEKNAEMAQLEEVIKEETPPTEAIAKNNSPETADKKLTALDQAQSSQPVIIAPSALNQFKEAWAKAKKNASIHADGSIVPFSETTQDDVKKHRDKIPFNTNNKSRLMMIIKGPFMQKMFKQTLGKDSYFYKILKKKNPVDVEREALAKDPRPWKKFIPKPTKYENAQYWLFKKTGGWFGNDNAEQYSEDAKPEFPSTKEGRRAKLLYALSTNNPNYISQWLNKTEWDKLDITAKARLRSANGGALPNFQEFWLQEKIQEAIKKLPLSVENLFADEE